MNSKDRDIKKLRKYANDLGLSVRTRPHSNYTGEAEYISGKYITLFVTQRTPKADIILSLLHELGHHLDWLEVKDTKESFDALGALVDGKMIGSRPDLTKHQRKIILQIEKAGVKYMSKIHRQLKLEIPFYRVKHQQEIDLFDYRFLYRYGRFATSKEVHNTVYKKAGYYKRKYGQKRKK